MGDTRTVILTIPPPEDWHTERYVYWCIYDEGDRKLCSGVEQGHSHTTLLEALQSAAAAARRHLRGAYR